MPPELKGVLIGGLIGIVASLISVVLNHVLEKSRDDKQYLRNKKLLLAEQLLHLQCDKGLPDDDPKVKEILTLLGLISVPEEVSEGQPEEER